MKATSELARISWLILVRTVIFQGEYYLSHQFFACNIHSSESLPASQAGIILMLQTLWFGRLRGCSDLVSTSVLMDLITALQKTSRSEWLISCLGRKLCTAL